MPRSIAFLHRHGIPGDILAEAARLARDWDVGGDRALLASGLLGEEALYRALAAETGLPYLDGAFDVHALARFPEAVLSGLAPLPEGGSGSRYVFAPREAAFEDLLVRRRPLPAGFHITSPGRLREAVFRTRAGQIARVAAEELPRIQPDDSFHGGLTLGQMAGMIVLVFVLGLGIGKAGDRATSLALLVLTVPFLGLTSIKIAAALEAVPPPCRTAGPRIPDSDLPVYTVLLALHREAEVLPKLLAALAALDYPAGRLDIKILLEEDDPETLPALMRLGVPPVAEVLVVPRGEPRTKPRALNVGLKLARGDLVTVYDAEDVPDPAQLRDAVAAFAAAPPDVACLQARLVIDNTEDGWLARFFTVEYGALFDVVNPALARFDLPIPLGGTSNHFRTGILRALGGWDAWNVTEDADLAVRLATAGYRVADLPSSTLEEAPARLGAWMGQRARWMKGYIQVSITHSRRPLRTLGRLGPARLFGAAAVVAGTVLSALLYPVLTLLAAGEILSGRIFEGDRPVELAGAAIGLTLFVAGILAMLVPGLVAIGRRGWWPLWPYALAMPLYFLLVSAGAWRGLYEFVLEPQSWNKTAHGLARTSRAARLGGADG